MDISAISKHYNSEKSSAHYCDAVDSIGLWKSEEMIFEKHVGKNDKILDMGCGAGRTTFGLHKLGYTNIVGLDITSSLIDYATNYSKTHNFDIDFVLCDARMKRGRQNSEVKTNRDKRPIRFLFVSAF